MAILNLINLETGDLSEFSASSGSVSASNASPVSGAYSARFNTSAALASLSINGQRDGALAELNANSVYFHTLFRPDSVPGTATACMAVYGVAASGSKLLAYLYYNHANQTLSMIYSDGTGAGVGVTGAPSVPTGTVAHVEIAITGANLTGGAAVAFRVNGRDGGSASGLTLNTAPAAIGEVRIGVFAVTTWDVSFDDIALSDSDWIGPSIIESIRPTGAGNYAAWAAGTGSTFAEVDDAGAHDGDTTYLKSATSGNKSTFALGNVASAVTNVTAVKAIAVVRDEGGAAAVAPMLRYSSTDAIGSYGDPGSSYTLRGYVRDTDPAGGAWSPTSANGLEAGVANNASVAARATYLAVLVLTRFLFADSENLAANVTEAEALLIALDADADSNAANVTEAEAVQTIDELADAENLAANVTETETVDLIAPVDAENLAANVTEAEAIAVDAADAENLAANVTEAEAVDQLIIDADSLAANVTETETVVVTGAFPRRHVRADVYSAAGVRLGPIPPTLMLACRYKLELDRIGSFAIDVPAEAAEAAVLAQGREIRIYREGEGFVFRGSIDRAVTTVNADGRPIVAVSGSSAAIEIARLSTLLGLAFSGASLAAAVGDDATAGSLLYATGWEPGDLASPATTLLARFDGLSRWEALVKVAEIFGLRLRENNLDRELDVITPGTASGLTFRNVELVTPELGENETLIPISAIAEAEQSEDLITTVIPLGAGEGITKLDLRYSNRSSPYTIQSATGPDGRTYYYLEDSAAVTAYGRRERVLSVKEALPLANSAAGFQAAANALYDVAAAYLARASSPLRTYTAEVVGLRHIASSGSPAFLLGETARVQYAGVVTDADGTRRAWKSIDENLYLMGIEREFAESGADSWRVTLANADRFDTDTAGTLAEAFSAMHALQVALRPYTYHETHILGRTSIQSGAGATMAVKWDQNLAYLHQAKITFKVSALRSNVSVAAAGGSATSSSGGATTSSGGSSHSHSISGSTSGGGSSHTHTVTGGTTVFNTGAYNATFVTTAEGFSRRTGGGSSHNHASATTDAASGPGSHAHTVTGGSGSEGSHTHEMMAGHGGELGEVNLSVTLATHTHSLTGLTNAAESSHTHTISGSTSGSEGSHTHTVSAHTHTVGDHTHTLTYGIYTASTPSSPAITITINGVDRTSALGGAWNTVGSDVELDITAYLQNGGTERPLQQANTIAFGASVLCDVEAVLRSRVTTTSLVPV